jgi:hypothetical protein
MLAGERLTLEEFAGRRDIADTPDDCIQQLKTFQQSTGCEYFLGIFGDSPDTETLTASIELFAAKSSLPSSSAIATAPRFGWSRSTELTSALSVLRGTKR